jgi:hypothetical protein
MIRYPLAIIIAMSSLSSAVALECRAELPQSRNEHWAWRIIDGKRCWYPGRAKMSKSNLHWPTTIGQRRRRDPAPAVAVEPATLRPDPVQPDERESAQPERELTFRERWPH